MEISRCSAPLQLDRKFVSLKSQCYSYISGSLQWRGDVRVLWEVRLESKSIHIESYPLHSRLYINIPAVSWGSDAVRKSIVFHMRYRLTARHWGRNQTTEMFCETRRICDYKGPLNQIGLTKLNSPISWLDFGSYCPTKGFVSVTPLWSMKRQRDRNNKE
jgi:hypothetical protein